MGKLRKLLALVLIGAVISLGGLGCKKDAPPADDATTTETKEKSAEHPEGEHPAGEKEHPEGEQKE